MNDTEIRRWTATINVMGWMDLGWRPERGEQVKATPSEYDLQRDQLRSAVREAGEYIEAGLGEVATIQLYKTTKANGTVPDQHWVVERDERSGKIRATR